MIFSSFNSKEEFLKKGLGMVILKNGEIVAGASSYTRYKEGIEIEVYTQKRMQDKILALRIGVKNELQIIVK